MIRKFNHIVILFLIPVAVIGVLAEIMLRNIPNDYKLKAGYLTTQSKNVETLILGSSHTMYGVNPEYFDDNAFNLSHVSQTIDIDYEMLKQYKPQMPNLKTVVLRLSYTTLFEKLNNAPEEWRLKDYTIYYDLPVKNKLVHHSEVLSIKWKTNLDRIYNYYVLNKTEQKCNSVGWGTDADSNNSKDLERTGPLTAKKHTIENKSLYNENLKTLQSIMKFCKDNHIKVILVTLPAYKSYIENLDKEQLESTINAGKRMEDTYVNCKYYNFLYNDEFEANDFFDADHLNEKGAQKFSLLINSLLKH